MVGAAPPRNWFAAHLTLILRQLWALTTRWSAQPLSHVYARESP
jgi:hypothetical protein